jgi:hypothetical protein
MTEQSANSPQCIAWKREAQERRRSLMERMTPEERRAYILDRERKLLAKQERLRAGLAKPKSA